MQVTIQQIGQLIKCSREVSDALAIAARKASDVPAALTAAMAWLEEQYDDVAPIGTQNIFGDVQTASTWAADRQRYSEAMAEVSRIGKILATEA